MFNGRETSRFDNTRSSAATSGVHSLQSLCNTEPYTVPAVRGSVPARVAPVSGARRLLVIRPRAAAPHSRTVICDNENRIFSVAPNGAAVDVVHPPIIHPL